MQVKYLGHFLGPTDARQVTSAWSHGIRVTVSGTSSPPGNLVSAALHELVEVKRVVEELSP